MISQEATSKPFHAHLNVALGVGSGEVPIRVYFCQLVIAVKES